MWTHSYKANGHVNIFASTVILIIYQQFYFARLKIYTYDESSIYFQLCHHWWNSSHSAVFSLASRANEMVYRICTDLSRCDGVQQSDWRRDESSVYFQRMKCCKRSFGAQELRSRVMYWEKTCAKVCGDVVDVGAQSYVRARHLKRKMASEF